MRSGPGRGTASDLVWERTCHKVDAAMLLKCACTRLAACLAVPPLWRSRPAGYAERVHTTAEAVGTAVDQTLKRQRVRVKGSAANVGKAA